MMVMVVQNLTVKAWEAYYVQEVIPGIVPMRVNSKQLKTDRYLEEFRVREATATASTRATASQTTKATGTAVTAPRTYHAMPDEDGFRNINDLLLKDDLIENELDLTGGPPIDHPIDPGLCALLSALPNDPSNDYPTDTPTPPRKRGRGSGNKPRMTAKRKRETAEAAVGATDHGEDAADIATARSEAARPAEASKPKRAGKQASKR
jgi:hypothetical protein